MKAPSMADISGYVARIKAILDYFAGRPAINEDTEVGDEYYER